MIWKALTTRQAHFAEGSRDARRFTHEVSALAAFRENSAEGYESLARLVGSKSTVGIFIDQPYEPAAWMELSGRGALAADGLRERDGCERRSSRERIEELGEKHVPDRADSLD